MTIQIRVDETITTYEGMKARFKEQGVKGYASEIISCDVLCSAAGRLVHKSRVIDWKNDWYEELIIDPVTGVIIHQCAEPLSEHQGHGSAKRRRSTP